MRPCHDPTLPVVVIYNNLETFYSFLRRATDPDVVHRRYFRGDQALFWLGADKLVFTSVPVPHAAYVRGQLGYGGTFVAAPRAPTPWLSLDILREAELLEQLVAYAGRGRTVQLIPYATTGEFLHLADRLRREHGLRVLLPESPAPDALWVRDHIDTKPGFREWAGAWLPDACRRLPQGTICTRPAQAAAAARQFATENMPCVIKAAAGESGIGHWVITPDACPTEAALIEGLRANPYLSEGPVVVEQLILSPARLSPSLEFCVPAAACPGCATGAGVASTTAGEPYRTYLSDQLFLGFGDFGGVLLDRALLEAPWYPSLVDDGLLIARRLQALGYAGHFDLDAIIDADGQPYLLEVNARRTGGTHAHEFALRQFGPDYFRQVTVLAHNRVASGAITDWPALQAALRDLLYPAGGELRGVVVTIASALAVGEFGCCIIAPSRPEVLALYAEVQRRVRAAGATARQPMLAQEPLR
jgi:hypothetical protein